MVELFFLSTGLGYLRFYPGIETLTLPMLSYPGRQVTASCEIASYRIQGLLEAYFKINKFKSGVQNKYPLLV